eukprot:scaffold4916_cov28-Tisochrysis_lutea.AAC.8
MALPTRSAGCGAARVPTARGALGAPRAATTAMEGLIRPAPAGTQVAQMGKPQALVHRCALGHVLHVRELRVEEALSALGGRRLAHELDVPHTNRPAAPLAARLLKIVAGRQEQWQGRGAVAASEPDAIRAAAFAAPIE